MPRTHFPRPPFFVATKTNLFPGTWLHSFPDAQRCPVHSPTNESHAVSRFESKMSKKSFCSIGGTKNWAREMRRERNTATLHPKSTVAGQPRADPLGEGRRRTHGKAFGINVMALMTKEKLYRTGTRGYIAAIPLPPQTSDSQPPNIHPHPHLSKCEGRIW